MKFICLFLAILFGFVNISKLIFKQNIPAANMILMAIGIAGFIVLQFNLI